jgi:hypothetical protein
MAYSGRRIKADPFTDLLFNVLLAFTLLMFLAIIFMNPIPKTGVINPKAEYIITVSWKDNSPDDIDTYVQSPTGELVWFRGTEAGFVHLDRDDRGLLNDTITVDGKEIQNPLNQEVVTIRAVVPGEYVVNVHYYATTTNKPIDVNVKVEKVNPQLEVIYYGTIPLEKKGIEKTATRFNITQDGAVNVSGNLYKRLVPNN